MVSLVEHRRSFVTLMLAGIGLSSRQKHLLMARFNQERVYCFTNVGISVSRSVCLSVGQSINQMVSDR